MFIVNIVILRFLLSRYFKNNISNLYSVIITERNEMRCLLYLIRRIYIYIFFNLHFEISFLS